MQSWIFRRAWRLFCLWVCVLGLVLLAPPKGAGADITNAIDWNRARDLLQKSRNGEQLSPADSAYLEEAKAARRARIENEGANARPDMARARELFAKRARGEQLTATEEEFLRGTRQKMSAGRAGQASPPPPRERTGMVPLDEMTAAQTYKGEGGGLYGGGRNVPPPALAKRAQARAAQIVPRDSAGDPSKDGKIVLLSMGMSNTTQEYSQFKKLADADPEKAAPVAVVDGAQGGQDAAVWSDPNARAWSVLMDRLKRAGVTSNQVQAIWMKHARISPSRFGDFPAHTAELEGHIAASLRLAQQRFPNLKLVYLSSRIYGGYATTALNPEPYAYESAFAVRHLVLKPLAANSKDDPHGPVLLWGPYLWCDGLTPRKSDGLVWKREDCRSTDGTHPSPSGQEKVARLLLGFLKNDPTSRAWFGKN